MLTSLHSGIDYLMLSSASTFSWSIQNGIMAPGIFAFVGLRMEMAM